MDAQLIQTLTVYALPVIFGITLHEAAHAYAAKMFGDMTAYQLGRVSLNPLRHIDPLGTVILPLIILVTNVLTGAGAPVFGWAKAVPVVTRNLREPKKHMAFVAAAGPLANVVMMVLWIMLFNANNLLGLNEAFLRQVAIAGISTNIALAALNLLPILPLDGGRILVGVLPIKAAITYSKLEPYGMMVVIVLMATHLIGPLMTPFVVVLSGLAELLIF